MGHESRPTLICKQIFGDKHMTIEDLMRERGELVKKGTLSEDGDLEFWEDGKTTKREKRDATESVSRSEQGGHDTQGPVKDS